MSTVFGDVDVAFENGARVDLAVTFPLDLGAVQDFSTLLDSWTFALPDLGPLVSLWGPVIGITWTLEVGVDPLLVPLPPSAWLLAAALCVVAFRFRRRRPFPSDHRPVKRDAVSLRRRISRPRHAARNSAPILAQGGSG